MTLVNLVIFPKNATQKIKNCVAYLLKMQHKKLKIVLHKIKCFKTRTKEKNKKFILNKCNK